MLNRTIIPQCSKKIYRSVRLLQRKGRGVMATFVLTEAAICSVQLGRNAMARHQYIMSFRHRKRAPLLLCGVGTVEWWLLGGTDARITFFSGGVAKSRPESFWC